MDIISDIQYQIKDIFYAEGDVVISFSNATLKGDSLTYNQQEKKLILEGNVKFVKGKHIVEGSKFEFNANSGEGSFIDAYGILDIKNFDKDFNLKAFENSENINSDNTPNITDIEYVQSASIGLTNKFEPGKRFNITDLNFSIPEISRWRFKTKELKIENSVLKSNDIFFTNDPYNQPQFVLHIKNFSGEIIENKAKIISSNTWLILDNKIKLPIGKRRIFDKVAITRWGIGSDYKEKDGFYISRSFKNIDISDKFI